MNKIWTPPPPKLAVHVSGVLRNYYEVICLDKHGRLKWHETIDNLVTTEGLNDLLAKYFKGASYTAAWYVGLVEGASPSFAAGDTLESHAGWQEFVGYDETTRQTLTLGTPASGSVNNDASKAVFTISAGVNSTIGGAFVTTSSQKPDGSGSGVGSGILYGAGAFGGGSRDVQATDTVNVKVTLTASSA